VTKQFFHNQRIDFSYAFKVLEIRMNQTGIIVKQEIKMKKVAIFAATVVATMILSGCGGNHTDVVYVEPEPPSALTTLFLNRKTLEIGFTAN